MHKFIFISTLLATVCSLPRVARADAIDDLVLTGGGHTISYSLPATTTFSGDLSIEFFYVSATATIDGMPGYLLTGGYDAIFSTVGTLQLFVPDTIFGYPSILFQGPQLVSTVGFPENPFEPFDLTATFLPGTYSLLGEGTSPALPPGPSTPYTLTITPQTATAATPEPSSLALLVTGFFGLVGFAAIKRRRVALLY